MLSTSSDEISPRIKTYVSPTGFLFHTRWIILIFSKFVLKLASEEGFLVFEFSCTFNLEDDVIFPEQFTNTRNFFLLPTMAYSIYRYRVGHAPTRKENFKNSNLRSGNGRRIISLETFSLNNKGILFFAPWNILIFAGQIKIPYSYETNKKKHQKYLFFAAVWSFEPGHKKL